MTTLHIINILLAIWVPCILPSIAYVCEYGFGSCEELFNPMMLHKGSELNTVWAIVVMIAHTVIMFPLCMTFLFYKLCTVGRR